jgi:MoaA/NifB/PqqE/SkfB family radical SAM enzyme
MTEVVQATYLKDAFVRDLLFKHYEYLERFVLGVPFPPYEVELQPSSRCNISCRWCMGAVSCSAGGGFLSDNITPSVMAEIVESLLAVEIGGLVIKTFRFAGFTGEPLVRGDITLSAIETLTSAGRTVGLFTNGTLMSRATWETLSRMSYVHVSLDAGRDSYQLLKGGSRKMFDRVLENIEGLRKYRDACARGVELHVGFVVCPENIGELSHVIQTARSVGVDSVFVKCDVTGRLGDSVSLVFDTIEAACEAYNSPEFAVQAVHSRRDHVAMAAGPCYPKEACHYQKLFGTIAPDGKMYPCDYNAMRCGQVIGDARSFALGWVRSHYSGGKKAGPLPCVSAFCPPIASAMNAFLQNVELAVNWHGSDVVLACLKGFANGMQL